MIDLAYVQNHKDRDKQLAASFRKDVGAIWSWLVDFIDRAPKVRQKGTNTTEMVSIAGKTVGELNRRGLGFGAEIKSCLVQKKIIHVDSAGVVYVHLARLPDNVRRHVCRLVNGKMSKNFYQGKAL